MWLGSSHADFYLVDANRHRPRLTPGRHIMCPHHPICPSSDAVDRDAARVVSSHPEQGWSLLCNGVVSFDDAGDLLPDGRIIAPKSYRVHHAAA
jgi:hypothetical protein